MAALERVGKLTRPSSPSPRHREEAHAGDGEGLARGHTAGDCHSHLSPHDLEHARHVQDTGLATARTWRGWEGSQGPKAGASPAVTPPPSAHSAPLARAGADHHRPPPSTTIPRDGTGRDGTHPTSLLTLSPAQHGADEEGQAARTCHPALTAGPHIPVCAPTARHWPHKVAGTISGSLRGPGRLTPRVPLLSPVEASAEPRVPLIRHPAPRHCLPQPRRRSPCSTARPRDPLPARTEPHAGCGVAGEPGVKRALRQRPQTLGTVPEPHITSFISCPRMGCSPVSTLARTRAPPSPPFLYPSRLTV